MSSEQLLEDSYAVLPLRDIVVFPGMIVPLFVGREKSIKALEEVANSNKKILLVTQKDATQDNPDTENIYRVGVLANILQLLRLPDGTVKVLVEGVERVKIVAFIDSGDFFQAIAENVEEKEGSKEEIEALYVMKSSDDFDRFIRFMERYAEENGLSRG